MKKIIIGEDNFENLINQDGYYVDKSKIIEELLDSGGGVKLFPRPSRFGKTLLISMLNNFFDIDKKEKNKDLFNGLYISDSKYKNIQNTYPVINLSFKNLKQNTFEKVIDIFKRTIGDLYNEKEYVKEILLESDKLYFEGITNQTANISDYSLSILKLSNFLYKYYNKKVIILIDEYDVPIQEGYLDGFYKDVVDFIRSVLSSALKTNNTLAYGILTGVLRVSKESIFSDLNNIKIYGINDEKYEEYFGFTEEETRRLFEYYGLELSNDVKDMYDGYDFGGKSIYNPWSLLNYVDSSHLDTYWVNTSGNDLIKRLLLQTNSTNKKQIENLVEGDFLQFEYNDKITYQDFDNYDDLNNLLNIMLSSGYLTMTESKIDILGNKIDYVKIPNLEVKKIITSIIAHLSIKGEETNNSYMINKFNIALASNDKIKVEEILNNMFMSLSFMDAQEYFCHAYTLGIFKSFLDSNRFIIKSNREGGSGRFDVSIRKKDNSIGFIIEFKLANNEKEMEEKAVLALNQMKEKEYYKELKLEGVNDIKEVAIVFYDKKVIVR